MCEYMDLEATQENKEVLKNLKNGECLFQDLDRHIGILRFDAVFQDIIDLFSTTPKARGQEAEQIDQTETEESRQSEKKVEENQTETMEDELNFEFDMEELLKKTGFAMPQMADILQRLIQKDFITESFKNYYIRKI